MAMKKNASLVFKIFLGLFLFISCNNNDDVSEVPSYSYTSPIVNPPAVFNIFFNISGTGDRTAEVSFEQNAVWRIEKLGDNRVNLAVGSGTDQISIFSSDTIGLQANSPYYVVVNNNNYNEFNNFYVGFTKLDLDYETFEPKL
jgi:hypothetical protein